MSRLEYRHNPEWDTLFFEDTDVDSLKYNIKKEVKKRNLGDIEVIDINITSFEYRDYVRHNVLVTYRPLPSEREEEVTIKDG